MPWSNALRIRGTTLTELHTAKNYWPEAELVNPSGAIVSGKAAIVQEHIDLWAGPFKGSQLAAKVRRVQMLGANYMIVDFDVQLSGFAKAPPGAPSI